MGRKKSIIKPKEPIKLRWRQLKNGNQTIYLDYYEKGRRNLEYLHLYLIPEVDEAARIMNANTIRAAIKIKNERISDLLAGKANIKTIGGASKKIKLLDWINTYANNKLENGLSKSSFNIIANMRNYLARFENNTNLIDVDVDFVSDFIHYLHNCGRILLSPKTGKEIKKSEPLSQKTISNYVGVLRSALKRAEDKGIISKSPFKELDDNDKRLFQAPKSSRVFLTIEEVRRMAVNNILENEQTKQAFMFACFTGLRLSDIRSFKWSDIQVSDGNWVRDFKQQKTNDRLNLPISDEAKKWMPKKVDGIDTIFYKLPKATCELDRQIKKWAKDAGIDKYVTFHTSRHTFATMLLTKDVDIYTVSKLLGHRNVSTTQIYADLVGQKKVRAINSLNGVLD